MSLSYEWHTANNTNPSSLVPDPTAVSTGIYWVFAKDSDGCFSLGTKVTVICGGAISCTAPQTLLVVAGVGGNKITFQGAAYPPPGNSYTVKRKSGADPDVDGSYTTIGTPTFNATSGRWEIVDTTADVNTLYTYKAISNCADATHPAALYNFANLTCPTVTLTPSSSSMGYSFVGVGGEVDKYEVKLYDATGNVLIHTDTQLPAFSNPITGTFIYLDAGVTYKVRVRVYIGTTYRDCDFVAATTDTTTSGAFSAFLAKSGVYSGTLTLSVFGGTAPYSYIFSCTGIGACESHTIDAPTGTLALVDDPPPTSPYSVVAYSGTTYQFVAQVTDFNGNVATSNVVTTLPCLVPETMILMKGGTREKQLGSLAVGAELFDSKIVSFERRTVDKLYDINNGLLKSSEGHIHIIKVDGKEIEVQAANLKDGDMLINRHGEEVPITSIGVHENAEFEVVDIQTDTGKYIANGILTHNKFACP